MDKYVVTSAQYEAQPNDRFLKSLDTYCALHNASLLVLPMAGKSKKEDTLDDLLEQYEVVEDDKKLNSNVKISSYQIRPQQIDPATGLARFAQNDSSTIFASPKQRMKVIPNSNTKLPKILMTTGAVTHPNYNTDTRIGRIAQNDHLYGAVVVEVVDNTTYHIRHITAQKNGKFYDLGIQYDGDKEPQFKPAEALVLGDWHTGDTDKTVKKLTDLLIEELQPKRIVLHDIFNGHSINHHEQGKALDLFNNRTRLDLEKELWGVGVELDRIIGETSARIYVAKSNHDEWLDRYLNEGRFIKEPQNLEIAVNVLADTLKGEDPLKAGIARAYGNVAATFLDRNDDLKVRGWQLANHGDLGANGARGSIRAIEAANGKSITGHKHTPERFRNVVVVGTSTKLRLSYNRGYSGWLNQHAVLYDDGNVQQINMVRGNYKGERND